MEIPQRSITSVTIPVLAESWKNKDIEEIKHIYSRSITNLLIVGLMIFAVVILNAPNLSIYLGKDFSGIKEVVVLMGIGKLFDLGTGVNAQIIATSNYWKVDFTTNVIYTLLALPLNYILISKFGLFGAAYSSIIALIFYNLMRFGFLWYKFNMQPYKVKDLISILVALVAGFLASLVPQLSNIIVDAITRTVIFLTAFLIPIYFANISYEINALIKKYVRMEFLTKK
jgi:O-antigen/teichoic acid export membrane protein